MTELAGMGVGKALADARRAQGLAIADVAQQLKFMPRQLEALEGERFNMLPGPTIARGMVRTYARFLKIDPEPLLAGMAGQVEVHDATPQLAARFSQPVPFSDSGRRSTVLYLALSACALAAAGGMVYEWRHERAAPEFVAAAKISERAADAPARAAPERTASASSAPLQRETVAPVPAAPPAGPKATVVSPPKATVAPPQPAKVAAAPAGAGEPKSISGNRIVLRFGEEAWLEVTDGAGRLLASSLNPAGSERVVQGKPPFNLVIGNASHVTVLYNDRAVDLQPHVKVEVARFTLK